MRRGSLRSIPPVLLALALLALPAMASAQAQTSLQALPSPFGPGATISLSASIVSTDPPSWCGPPWCAAFPYAWIAISGSNGFWAFADAWDTQVSLQTGDPGPGQTLQATSYQAVGEIVWMTCEPYWDCSDPGEHIEHGSAQASVVPQPAPSISLLDPGSGLVGTVVTISGAHFTGTQGAVSFNGVGAGISHWSDTSITATVPGGATSGPVVVTAGGQSSPGVAFTVGTVPTLDGLTPTSGSGLSATFTAQYSSAAGPAGVRAMGLSVGVPFDPAACFVYYDAPTQQLHLMNDTWTAWLPPVPAGWSDGHGCPNGFGRFGTARMRFAADVTTATSRRTISPAGG